ncbi:MAG: insulinase family protein [Deltaproteobacteria bacterium]|nr:insulinase family protein [Deltaproteobacteria bacterium]
MSSAKTPLPIRSETLDNGAKVVLLPSRGAPVVAVQVWVDVGSADERDDEGGLAHVHEHMLFKGTEKRGVGAIAAEVEASGGDINAWTSYDQTVYHVVLASRFFETGLDILSDAISNSTFEADELEKELEVILEEIKRSEDQPQSRVSRALFDTGFDVHPYCKPVIGHAEVVAKFSREQILDFYRSHYAADRLTIICVGDFETDDALAKVKAAFGSLKASNSKLPEREKEPVQKGPRAKGLTDKVEESQLALAWHGPSIRDPDLAAVDVLCVLLGQGESSRLVRRVKNEKQCVNHIYSYAYTPRDAGLVVVGASLRHEKLAEAMNEVGTLIGELQKELCSDEELAKAKAMLRAEEVYQRETVEGLARRIGYWATSCGDADHETIYEAQVQALTALDIQRVAKKYLRKDNLTCVSLVPENEADVVKEERLLSLVEDAFGSPDEEKEATAVPAQTHRPKRNFSKLLGGGRVIIESDSTNPIVTARLGWLGGLRGETPEVAGYYNLISEMVTRGTALKTAKDIANLSDSMAGSVDAFSGRNSFGLRCSFLKENFNPGFELLIECLRAPSFDDKELIRTKELVLEDLRTRADNPAGLCFDLFNKTLWKQHPYRDDVLGTKESISTVTRDKLQAFYEERISPHQGVMAVVGDIEFQGGISLASRALRGYDVSGVQPESWAPIEEEVYDGMQIARRVRDRAQAHMILGTRGFQLSDSRRHVLEVLSAILSGQGGRLFLELRDRQSLCYSVSAFSVEGIEAGSFSIYMGTSPDKVDQGLKGIEDLVDELMQDGVTDKEIARAKRYLIGTHDIGLQRLGARANLMSFNALYGLGFAAHLEYAKHIEAVTAEDVRVLAQEMLDVNRRVLSIVGPEDTGGPKANCDPKGVAGG